LLTETAAKVYIGNTGVIAFLPFVRDVFRQYAGTSNFTEPDYSNTMLEVEVQSTQTPEMQPEVGLEELQECVRIFFSAASLSP
jgi:hypothetical protein